MTRSKQFELFHRYFDAENDRYEHLNRRATIYLSVVSGLSLFAGIKLGDIEKTLVSHWLTLTLASTSGILILACLLAIVQSLRVYSYKDVCAVEQIVIDIDENQYSEEDVFSILLGNLADATRTNRRINDRRARFLEWAVALLGVAIATFIAANVSSIWLLT